MDFLLARPGFQDPDTGEMVYVDSACEIFHKLLGFPEQHETIRGSPNKSGNVPCTHVYGLGYPYRRTWHYDNKNGTKLFFWNEAGPVTYIYSNGKPMFQNPAPSLGRPVFDANVTIPMDEKIGLPKHANQQGIDFTNVESKWSIASAMGGIHEVVADSIAHFYPPDWGSQPINTVLKIRMPSRSGTIFTFEDGMVSRYPRDTPIPPKLNILSTGQVYMGESEMDMSTKKSIVAAKEKELRNERTRDLRRARNPSIRSQKAIAKQQRREERVKRRVARKAARKARRAAAHERQGSGRKGRQKPIGPRTDETEVSPQTLQQMQQESSKRRETRRGTESEDY